MFKVIIDCSYEAIVCQSSHCRYIERVPSSGASSECFCLGCFSRSECVLNDTDEVRTNYFLLCDIVSVNYVVSI